MKQLIYILLVVCGVIACNDKAVGFLIVDDASYDPDVMTVRLSSELDPVEDADRIRLKFPWVSPEVQGVLGTVPYQYYLENIYTSDGDIDSFKKYAKVRIGDGSVEIPYDHQIKKGTYVIGINICNEGYSLHRDSLLSIIVK